MLSHPTASLAHGQDHPPLDGRMNAGSWQSHAANKQSSPLGSSLLSTLLSLKVLSEGTRCCLYLAGVCCDTAVMTRGLRCGMLSGRHGAKATSIREWMDIGWRSAGCRGAVRSALVVD